MTSDFKRTTTVFGGYLYQNLVGLELLCDWLDDPGLYEWVTFEADDEALPKGLDDIVARRRDGSSVLLQVKFTVDPFDPGNLLSWEWLLARKGQGTCPIKKWIEAFHALKGTSGVEAALVTNRLPDREFHSCFHKTTNKVDSEGIPSDIYARLVEEARTEARLLEFLAAFEFRHSHEGYLALERTLLDRYVPRHTTHHGWICLFREAIDWAVRRRFPPPNGRIALDIVRGVLDSRRPQPLPQSFRVPLYYSPPDEEFSERLLESVATKSRHLVILWGSPGQGKSTYLSYLCSRLEQRKVPFIRHHYFLSLGDASDRFSLFSVANSLISQMEVHHTEHVQGLDDKPEELRKWIEACAAGYELVGLPFVVVVDGLDHVWRENDRNTRPLDRLFEALFPLPANVVLLVGTQRVSDAQLPAPFAQQASAEAWLELPRMTLAAIKTWLEGQLAATRFSLPEHTDALNGDPLTDLASAFERLSGGHPLLLTYAFEALARVKRVLNAKLVDEVSIRPEGDIKRYYQTLWQGLSFEAKDALHLIADAGFVWPPLGLETCLRTGAADLWGEIGHLFYLTDAGQVPFHGSLLVFVQAQGDHQDRLQYLLPKVVSWLESDAPHFHRWGWLWLYKARTSDWEALVDGPNREWVLNSLANAYPVSQVAEVLSAAERRALETYDFPRAVHLRSLKIRVLNGIDFQIESFDRLYGCALALTQDDYPLKLLSAESHAASIDRLYLLANSYLSAGRYSEAAECQEQLRKRVNDRLKAHAFDESSLESALKQYLKVCAATKKYKVDDVLRSILAFRRLARPLFALFLRELSKHRDLALLMAFVESPMSRSMRQELELAAIRLAGACQAHIHEWPQYSRFRAHPVSGCWSLLYAPNKYRPPQFATYQQEIDINAYEDKVKDATETYLHKLFFHVLGRTIELKGAPANGIDATFKNRSWLTEAARRIVSLANTVGAILARGESPHFALPYRLLDHDEPPTGYEAFRDYVAFRRTLLDVANDLHALTTLRSARTHVSPTEWERVWDSRHFLFSEWLERYLSASLQPMPREALERELNTRLLGVVNKVSPFNERVPEYLELCELACAENLGELAAKALRRAVNCVIGYGWRKDGTLSHALSAISAISAVDQQFAIEAIRRVAPMVCGIGDMTEDDAVDESDLADLLLRLMPERYVSYYTHWLTSSEWYTADVVFAEMLEHVDLAHPLMAFATCALWDERSIGALRSREKEGDELAGAIVRERAKRLGRIADEQGKERPTDTPAPEGEEGRIDVRMYPPEDLDRLARDLTDAKVFVGQRAVMREWFDYWRGQGKDIELLRIIEPLVREEQLHWGIEEQLDELFDISLRLEGKSKAYRWLVAAQIHGHGWDPHFSGSSALARFKVFAQYYSDTWAQFVLDTSKPAYPSATEKLVIPHHRLVNFLLAVEQPAVAKAVAESMVATVVEEFSDQPLEAPQWLSAT